MALIKCVQCKREISSRAETCPHCGDPDPQRTEEEIERIRQKNKYVPTEEEDRLASAMAFAFVLVSAYLVGVLFGGEWDWPLELIKGIWNWF